MNKHIEYIEIARSYSKTKQEAPYEPANYFSSYKAICKPGTPKEVLDAISESLAERCEDEVMSKIDPSKTISRRQTTAELRTKLAEAVKRIEALEQESAKSVPF